MMRTAWKGQNIIFLPKNSEFSENSDLLPWPQRVLRYPARAPKIIYWAIMANFLGMNSDYG